MRVCSQAHNKELQQEKQPVVKRFSLHKSQSQVEQVG